MKRVARQFKHQPATEETGGLTRQRGELVAAEPQHPEAGELADLRGQRGELISAEPQFLEASRVISGGSAVN